MKALRTKVCTYAIALLVGVGFSTPSNAGSGDFAGIFGAVSGSAGGAGINGRHVDTTSEVNEGQLGAVFPMAGFELGFNLPIGPVFFLGIGHSRTFGGSAEIADGEELVSKGGGGDTGSEGNDASRTNFSLTAKDLKEVYIMPSISIYDNSAIYVKLGRGIADLDATGNVTGAPGNLTGDLIGFGTIAMTPSGLFIKTEGSVTRYNDIRLVGINGSTGAYVEGTPNTVAGTVAVGFKF